MAKNNEQSMVIDGIAAAETVDSSGEILSVKGCDISSLKEGKGVLNWEHQGPNVKKDDDKRDTPKNAIGKITYAKKIFELGDCEDDRQRFFYKKINVPYIYIKARLFDGSGHEDAKAAAASFRDAVTHKEAPLINFSIEGHTIEKDGNKIKVSMARAVAATHKPCNKAAVATVLHDPVTGEKHEIEGKKKDDILGSLAVEKNEIPGKQILSSVPVDYDPVVQDDSRYLFKCAVENLQKTLTAGGYGGAPGTLTGGACLQREDLRKKVVTKFLKNQFLGALRDFDPYVHKDFKKFLKSRLPEVDDAFIEYFNNVAEDFKMRKSEEYRVRRLEFLTLELKKAGLQNQGPPEMPDGYQVSMFKLDSKDPTPAHVPAKTRPQPVQQIAPTRSETPIHLNAAEHGIEQNTHPEQHELVHGLHFNQPDQGGIGLAGLNDTRKVKLPNGQHGFLKRQVGDEWEPVTDLQSTAHAEVVYHNAAKHFFGLGHFVPTTAGVAVHDDPYKPPVYHSVMAAVPNGRHLHDVLDENGNPYRISDQNMSIIQQHGDSGDLDKLALMNSVLGNRDRHSGNFMFSDNQMHLIDHGHTFSYREGRPSPADPGYLSRYHEAKTQSWAQNDWLNIKLHPEAAKWAMGLKPQQLVKFLRGQGATPEIAMHAGQRLAGIQHLIQQKGLDTGVWEAYNLPWGDQNPDLHGRLLAQKQQPQAVA